MPMEFEQAWNDYNDEPALQSTGWESAMEMLPSPRGSGSGADSGQISGPMDAVMAISVETPAKSSLLSAETPKTEPKKPEKMPLDNLPACPSTQVKLPHSSNSLLSLGLLEAPLVFLFIV